VIRWLKLCMDTALLAAAFLLLSPRAMSQRESMRRLVVWKLVCRPLSPYLLFNPQLQWLGIELLQWLDCWWLLWLDVTGPATATKALLYIFDIFGYFPQSLQGADILSTSDKDHEYQVFMPDWFEGKPADISWYVLPILSSIGPWNVYKNEGRED